MDSHKQMVLTFCNITALSCEHNPAAFRPSEFLFFYDELMGGMPQIALSTHTWADCRLLGTCAETIAFPHQRHSV